MLDTNPPFNWRDYFQGARYLFATLDSTQKYLRNHPPLLSPIFCQTITQTHGEGQRGRVWQQTGEALLFSCAITLPGELALQQGLTQAIALAIVNALDTDKTHLQLKWPNDIYFQQRKLAGILIEGSNHPLDNTQTQIIIGIGMNITNDNASSYHTNTQSDIAYWQEICAEDSADTVLDKIMPSLISCFENWAQRPYLTIDHNWHEYDMYYQKHVHLENHNEKMLVLGIDQKGRLLCRDNNKTLHYLINTRILKS